MKELNRPQLSVSVGTPLPRRTGHGDFPHPALARVACSREHSQLDQSHMLQVRIEANSLTRPPASLTAAVQVFAQTVTDEMIDALEGLTRVAQLEVVGPASQVSVQSLNQFGQRCVTLLVVDELSQHFLFPQNRFARWLKVPVASSTAVLVEVVSEGVAQKVQALTGLLQVNHPRFLA